MRRPSGDQFGLASPAELSVSLVTFDPSVSITYISESPSRSELNAMRPVSTGVWGVVGLDVRVGVGVGVGVGVKVDTGVGVASPVSRTVTYSRYSIDPESLVIRTSASPFPTKESSSAPMVMVASMGK